MMKHFPVAAAAMRLLTPMLESMLALTLALTSLLISADKAFAGSTPADPRATLYIGWPNDGQVLPSGKPFRVWFGLRYMGVAPSGVEFPNTGHHHLLIDTDLPPMDQKIPSDRKHLHFGAGETETTLELPPGNHTLQLLLGDANHVPHKPPVYSKKITIIVK
jgi:hypothetical protein